MQSFASLLVAVLCLVHAEEDNSYLKILIPTPLTGYFQTLYPLPITGIPHSQALFGSPSYGGDKRIVGQVFYVTPEDTQNGCDLTNAVIPKKSNKEDMAMIFLVDRGTCDFVQKVRLAEARGASAVIIADNVCQCDALLKWKEDDVDKPGRTKQLREKCLALARKAVEDDRFVEGQTCEMSLPFMADDGQGDSVHIPSFLISYLDAHMLKECMNTENSFCKDSQKVIASLEWDLPHKTLVNWDLWSSSDSDGAFKKSFASIAAKLEGKTVFRPRYFIWNGALWGCDVDPSLCGTQCTEGGRYCNPDPDTLSFNGVTGEAVVQENLRELCVWEKAMAVKKPMLWWTYVSKFATQCHPGSVAKPDLFTAQCSSLVHSQVEGLSFKETQDCVAASWDGPRNVKLEKELVDRNDLKLLQLPTVMVNEQLLRGGVTTFSILSTICAGFVASASPPICTCVDGVNSASTLEQCLNTNCANPGEYFCAKNKQCYPDYEAYLRSCSTAVITTSSCVENYLYCSSLLQCLPKKETCPVCLDLSTPLWCMNQQRCVGSTLDCLGSSKDLSGSGSASTFQVFVIACMVAAMSGAVGYYFWRRQKARLHDDVKAILESYRALDQEGDDHHPGGNNHNGPTMQI